MVTWCAASRRIRAPYRRKALQPCKPKPAQEAVEALELQEQAEQKSFLFEASRNIHWSLVARKVRACVLRSPSRLQDAVNESISGRFDLSSHRMPL